MRCENCDAICEWKGDFGCDEDHEKDRWIFVRQFKCNKCQCELLVYYPKEPTT